MTESTRREGQDDATRRESPTPLGAGADVTRREASGAPGTRREEDANSTRREHDGVGGDLASSLGQFGLLAQVPSLAERYTLDRAATQKLGPEGGQAQLAVVLDTHSENRLVLKVYNRGTSLDERAMDKLIEMGRDPVGAQHVLPILDTGTDPHSGLTWEVQEYMAAGSLEQLFAQQTIPPDFATALTREMSTALTFVHARGVTHRDLKPGNILIRTLEPLDVVVADFGLAMQQDLSVVVRSVAGSWPYLPPESRANEFTPAMDWWALGLILAKGLTGRHMFQEPGGPRMLDDATIANQLARRTYTIPASGDERWDLLIAGLLTAEYRHRWSTAQVEEWLAGGTPEVHAPPAVAVHAATATSVQPFAFAGADYDTPAALAAGFRTKWQEAGDLLIGRGREDLLTWLRRTTIGTTADAILDRKDLRNPEAPLLRLQVLLDPATIPAFRGQTLSTDGFNAIIDQARNGESKAVNWITGLRKERILSAWAGEAAVPAEIRRADDLLRGWWNNVENLLSKVPGEQAAQIRQALEPVLLEAALNSDARDRVSAAGQRVAAEASVLPSWAAPIKAAAVGTTIGPEHAALALATLPAAEKAETARLKGVQEAEQRRQREQREEQQRQDHERRQTQHRAQRQAKSGQVGELFGLAFMALWPGLVLTGVCWFLLSGGTQKAPDVLPGETIFITLLIGNAAAIGVTAIVVALLAPAPAIWPAWFAGLFGAAVEIVSAVVVTQNNSVSSTSFGGATERSELLWGPILMVVAAVLASLIARARGQLNNG